MTRIHLDAHGCGKSLGLEADEQELEFRFSSVPIRFCVGAAAGLALEDTEMTET